MSFSHSDIMDFPIFPDDTEPKALKGIKLSHEWMPWLGGILYDLNGNPIPFFLSIKSNYGSGTFIISGQTYNIAFDYAANSFINGVLTLGTMPKIIIDYKVPHHVMVYITSDLMVDLTCTFRGPPLWYSKTTNQVDMLQITDTAWLGGYDACIRLTGILQSGVTSIVVNGFGVWEHSWTLGTYDLAKNPRLWMFINDEKYYGIVLICWSYTTGKTLIYTGRLGSEGRPTYRWDEVQWIDDGTNRPRYVALRGPFRDVGGVIWGNADIKTDPAQAWLLFNSIWVEHPVVTGTLDSNLFNGMGWSEVLKIGVVPPPPPPPTCAIATAAYGSPLAPQLNSIRWFRDHCLPIAATKAYYQVSPYLAKVIASSELLRLVTQGYLKPIVLLLKTIRNRRMKTKSPI